MLVLCAGGGGALRVRLVQLLELPHTVIEAAKACGVAHLLARSGHRAAIVHEVEAADALFLRTAELALRGGGGQS